MLTRSLDKARDAFEKKSVESTIAAHRPGVRADESYQEGGSYIKSVNYGDLDGTITPFAAVAGVTGVTVTPLTFPGSPLQIFRGGVGGVVTASECVCS